MPSFSFEPHLTERDLDYVDPRILKAMAGWKVVTKLPSGGEVSIPDTWGSSIHAYKYFEVIKEPGDPNPGVDGSEDEIQCYLGCGWKGYDDEVVIVLTLLGKAVKDSSLPVVAEIYKFGGYDMEVYRNGRLVTDFTRKRFFGLWKQKINKCVVAL